MSNVYRVLQLRNCRILFLPGSAASGAAADGGRRRRRGIDGTARIWYAGGGMRSRLAALGLLGVGFYVAGVIILGVVAGRWLDSRFASEPLWLIVGLVLGVVAAFYGVYAMLRPFFGDRRNGEE